MPLALFLKFHESMGIASSDNHRNPTEAIAARASPCFRGQPFFSNVAIEAEGKDEDECDWYGKVFAFVSFETWNPENLVYERFELALAEYYEDVTDAVDAASPFPILEKHGAWGLVDIKNVLRQVQVLPDFVYGTRFILNTHTIYEIIVF